MLVDTGAVPSAAPRELLAAPASSGCAPGGGQLASGGTPEHDASRAGDASFDRGRAHRHDDEAIGAWLRSSIPARL